MIKTAIFYLIGTPHCTMFHNTMYWMYTDIFRTRDMARIHGVIYTVSLWLVIAEANVNSATISFLGHSGSTDDKAKALLQGLSSICLSFFQVISTFPHLPEVKTSSVLTNQGKGQKLLLPRYVWAVFGVYPRAAHGRLCFSPPKIHVCISMKLFWF